MIVAYLLLVIGLCLYDARNLYKKGLTKDMFVLIGSMVLVAAFGVTYLLSDIHSSLIDALLNFVHVKG